MSWFSFILGLNSFFLLFLGMVMYDIPGIKLNHNIYMYTRDFKLVSVTFQARKKGWTYVRT